MSAVVDGDALEQALDHETDDRYVMLRDSLQRVQRKLDQATLAKAELVDAVYQAAKDASLTFSYKLVPKPVADRRRGVEETAIAVLSDWQLAKVTPDYTSDVCRTRIEQYAKRIERLVEIQRKDHPVRTLKVYLLGDLVEGELIFPGQSHRVDSSLYTQVCKDGPDILVAFIRHMLRLFDRVEVIGVIGNHGRLGGRSSRDYHPESNADAMMYEVSRVYLLQEIEAGRLAWTEARTKGERHWWAMDAIGEKKFFLFHGDQVKGYNGIPWYGFDRKVKAWDALAGHIPEIFDHWGRFDYALAGHFHTPTRLYLNGITLWVSGSTESFNTYAAEQLAAAGRPSQWLLFAHPKHGVTAEYEVHLG